MPVVPIPSGPGIIRPHGGSAAVAWNRLKASVPCGVTSLSSSPGGHQLPPAAGLQAAAVSAALTGRTHTERKPSRSGTTAERSDAAACTLRAQEGKPETTRSIEGRGEDPARTPARRAAAEPGEPLLQPFPLRGLSVPSRARGGRPAHQLSRGPQTRRAQGGAATASWFLMPPSGPASKEATSQSATAAVTLSGSRQAAAERWLNTSAHGLPSRPSLPSFVKQRKMRKTRDSGKPLTSLLHSRSVSSAAFRAQPDTHALLQHRTPC